MPQSLRSRLILASLLWTSGLLMLMHMTSLLLIHAFPAMRGFHSVAAVAAALLLMFCGLAVVRRTLTPFALLREKLAAVRLGPQRRVEGVYPAEVQPLIDELNALLENREKAIQRAFSAAGDLAHGLKTPLALLTHEAGQTRAAGHRETADSIAHQVERMSRHVHYHLARARAAASGPAGAAPCPLAPCADALVRTMAKLHAARALRISSVISPGAAVPLQREDLDEILGNLLDNACQWARSSVALAATVHGPTLVITVDDDGPGLAPDQRAIVLERGVRLDQSAPGSGLGLAIVRDLADLYGGSITLQDSPLGGLRARLTLPLKAL